MCKYQERKPTLEDDKSTEPTKEEQIQELEDELLVVSGVDEYHKLIEKLVEIKKSEE